MDKDSLFEQGFIGAGWAFTPGRGTGVNGEGGIALSKGDYDIAKSIYLILSTAPGERVMRPEFGCGIHDLVFASPGPQLFGLVAYHVTQALGRWEPRIELQNVEVTTDKFMPEKLLVDITYTVRQTNNERNLVYPFYVIPRGEE
jgi:phage baseplate assembly protein W